MAGLLKSLPPRATRQSDAAIVSKAAKSRVVTPTIKGGSKGIYDKISTISAVVNTKLGKYKDQSLILLPDKSQADIDTIKFFISKCKDKEFTMKLTEWLSEFTDNRCTAGRPKCSLTDSPVCCAMCSYATDCLINDNPFMCGYVSSGEVDYVEECEDCRRGYYE